MAFGLNPASWEEPICSHTVLSAMKDGPLEQWAGRMKRDRLSPRPLGLFRALQLVINSSDFSSRGAGSFPFSENLLEFM